MRQCPWILQAPTMSAAIGTKNKMRTRVERREKPSDLLIPYKWSAGARTATCQALGALGALGVQFVAESPGLLHSLKKELSEARGNGIGFVTAG